MPHKKGHSWGDLGSQITTRVKNAPKRWKDRLKIATDTTKKAWQSDSNPVQAVRNKAAGIGEKPGAAGRIQKSLLKKGFSKTQLRNTGDAHKAWKKAKSQGKDALKKWERKYHPDRIKAGKSRYGNKSGNKHKDRPRRGY